MKHLSDGALRRSIDEPFAMTSSERGHVQDCARCESRLASIRHDIAIASSLLSGSVPVSDTAAAMSRLRARDGMQRSRLTRHIPVGSFSQVLAKSRWTWATGLGVVVGKLVAFTPASSLARDFITIFQPTQIATISVTPGDLRSLPDLRAYGNLHVPTGLRVHQYSRIGPAATAAGMRIQLPSYLPPGVPTDRTFQVAPAQTSSFTFSAAKAARVVAREHKRLPRVPSEVDGTTIELTTRPAVITIYGHPKGIPALVVGEMEAPRITSSGADLKTVERFILHLPGVSPSLARQIEAIGSPETTLPIPIPVNLAYAEHVTVRGHRAVLVNDKEGIASVVIWKAGGVIYGVAGSATGDQIMQVADSLH